MLAVAGPRAFEVQGFTALHPGKSAGDSDLLRIVAGAEFGDGEVGLLVGEDDALEDAGELFGAHG